MLAIIRVLDDARYRDAHAPKPISRHNGATFFYDILFLLLLCEKLARENVSIIKLYAMMIHNGKWIAQKEKKIIIKLKSIPESEMHKTIFNKRQPLKAAHIFFIS